MGAPFHSVLIRLPSHVAQIIRRFRRICAAVGSMSNPHGTSFVFLLTKSLQDQRVIFVSCSATISKPSQHMKRLFGVEVCFNAPHCVSFKNLL
jgi:DEAD/DEAH box helicase domain-containing protein